jgi:hypothetical protein
MFEAKVTQKNETHILCSITFSFPKIVPFMRERRKYSRPGQATDNNMAHAHCMRYTYGYTHTLGCVQLIAVPQQRLHERDLLHVH